MIRWLLITADYSRPYNEWESISLHPTEDAAWRAKSFRDTLIFLEAVEVTIDAGEVSITIHRGEA